MQGGASTGYKKYVSENGTEDDTYSDNGVALFRVQGSGPKNMQAIQVDTAAPSLNSSYCYILHDGDTLFTWVGNLSSSMDHGLAERQLDVLKAREIFNFTQDDMMTKDIYILDCHICVFIWVGQHVDTNIRAHALSIGENFLELDILMENLAQETPLYVITEGSEPQFFTRFFFTWDFAKSAMHGNSFERRLSIVKNGVKPIRDKPKTRPTTSYVRI